MVIKELPPSDKYIPKRHPLQQNLCYYSNGKICREKSEEIRKLRKELAVKHYNQKVASVRESAMIRKPNNTWCTIRAIRQSTENNFRSLINKLIINPKLKYL